MSSFRTLQTAYSGLTAAQANLSVTGHNMANVNNLGYTRQSIIQSDSFYQRIGSSASSSMQVGLGTNVQTLRQIRDKYLDKSFRGSAATVGFYNVLYNTGITVQDTLGEMEGEYKLQSVLKDMWDSLEELNDEPGSVATRLDFLTNCGIFIDKIEDTYKNLRNQQSELNDQIIEMTGRVNELIAEINDLSKLISKNEIAGDNANDYRDARNNALDELSNYIDITYREKADKSIDIFSEGTALLANGSQRELGFRYCSTDTDWVEVVITGSDEILKYDQRADTFFRYNRDVSNALGNDGGALKGLLVARGLRPVTYADTEDQLKARYDSAMGDLLAGGNINTNGDPIVSPPSAAALADMEAYEQMKFQYERDRFTVRNCFIPKTMIELDTLVNKIVNMVNETFAPTQPKGATGDREKAELPDPPYSGPEYTYPYDLTGDSTRYTPIFVRKSPDYQYDPTTDALGTLPGEAPPGYGKDPDGSMEGDYYSLFTIGNFEINPIFNEKAGYNYLTLSPTGDISDNRLVEDLLEQWNPSPLSTDGAEYPRSVNQIYAGIITDIAIDLSEYGTISSSETEILMTWDNRRQQISGVSLEEEMANMLRFQHSYNAAARVVNYVDSMIDRIINRTGRVGL